MFFPARTLDVHGTSILYCTVLCRTNCIGYLVAAARGRWPAASLIVCQDGRESDWAAWITASGLFAIPQFAAIEERMHGPREDPAGDRLRLEWLIRCKACPPSIEGLEELHNGR